MKSAAAAAGLICLPGKKLNDLRTHCTQAEGDAVIEPNKRFRSVVLVWVRGEHDGDGSSRKEV